MKTVLSVMPESQLRISQGSEETEDFVCSVLVHQFISGLAPALRPKVARSEGDFEHLLIKARFEKAKLQDLASSRDGQQGMSAP